MKMRLSARGIRPLEFCGGGFFAAESQGSEFAVRLLRAGQFAEVGGFADATGVPRDRRGPGELWLVGDAGFHRNAKTAH